MGLFKNLPDKPYTKADYYREAEERQAAKNAARVPPVVVTSEIKEPEWLEPETMAPDLSEPAVQEVQENVVPLVEDVISDSVVESFSSVEQLPKEEIKEVEPIVSTEVLNESTKEVKSVTKKRKKS